MTLAHSLPPIKVKDKKRVGRGYGSGKGGHTSSRGQKGQKSRRGAKIPLYFEGGNLPLVKRLPMLRGKRRLNVVRAKVEITLTDLQKLEPAVITIDTLKLAGLVKPGMQTVKIIATGTLQKAVTVEGIKTTAAARTQIESAGGQVK